MKTEYTLYSGCSAVPASLLPTDPPALRQVASGSGIMLERLTEIHSEKKIIRILRARQIRTNHGRRIGEHAIEATEKQSMHMAEMAGMLMTWKEIPSSPS